MKNGRFICDSQEECISSDFIFLSIGWNMDPMTGARAAILDHEDESWAKDYGEIRQKGLGSLPL